MALDVVAVESFTQGRLNRDDPDTARQLDAALAAARNYCGWHVTPVLTNDQVTLDGPGGPTLMLPTMALGDLTSIIEDTLNINLLALSWSARGMVVKRRPDLLPSNYLAYHRLPWDYWTDAFRGITVTMTHGFASAADFDAAILSAIERGGFAAGSAAQLRSIGPFQYDTSGLTGGAIFSPAELAVLDRYALEPSA